MLGIRAFTAGIAITVAISGFSVFAQRMTEEIAINSVVVMVNGKTIAENNLVYQDTTYVPLRATFEAMACTVDFDEQTNTASITGKVKKPEDVLKIYHSYEEELEAQNDYYAVLIADQQQKGNTTELERLQEEHSAKTAALKIKWDEKAKQAVPEQNYQQVDVEFGVITVLVNGEPIRETNILYNERTYVPLRVISNAIGCEVVWDEGTRTASIYGEPVVEPEPDDLSIPYEQAYENLKKEYDQKIAEQIALGDQKYQEEYTYSVVASGGKDAPNLDKAIAVRAEHYEKAEDLKEEFNQRVAALKVKYNITE